MAGKSKVAPVPQTKKIEKLPGKLDQAFVQECRKKLLETKSEILNRFSQMKQEIVVADTTGDEADQSSRSIAEQSSLAMNNRLRAQLLEIEGALERIARGTYGICEETEEPIEPQRLLAIPWTRLSIEGAEIREAISRKYAK